MLPLNRQCAAKEIKLCELWRGIYLGRVGDLNGALWAGRPQPPAAYVSSLPRAMTTLPVRTSSMIL